MGSKSERQHPIGAEFWTFSSDDSKTAVVRGNSNAVRYCCSAWVVSAIFSVLTCFLQSSTGGANVVDPH